jgi:hypothetical protein
MGVFQLDVFQNDVFQVLGDVVEPPEPEPAPQPPAQSQPAGSVYAPATRSKPRRIIFLEREIIEKQEEQKEAEQQARALELAVAEAEQDKAAEARLASLYRNQDLIRIQIEALKREIAQHQAEVAEAADEDDAVAVILAATLH